MKKVATFRCKDPGLACDYGMKAEGEMELMKRIDGSRNQECISLPAADSICFHAMGESGLISLHDRYTFPDLHTYFQRKPHVGGVT
jgi:hypothetical protein